MSKTLHWVDWMTSGSLTAKIRFFAAVVLIYGVIACAIPTSRDPGDVPDIDSYVAMAHGDYASSYAPFSSRILDPFLAFWLSHLTHISVETAFAAISAFALAIFILVSLCVINLENSSLLWLFPYFILFSPWLMQTAQAYLMPEMLHAMFAACLFWALARGSRLWPVLLLLLFITRESTILLAVTLAAVFWLKRQRLSAITALVSCGVGMLVQHRVSSLARPNIHDLSAGPYLVEKVLHHGTLNLTGLHFLANSSHFYNNFHKVWSISVPLSFMDITQVAFLGFEPYFPLLLLVSFLTLFGVAPLAVLFGLRHFRSRILADAPIEVLTAIAYGLLSFLAAPFLGDAIARYVSTAWPIAVVALPWIVKRMHWSVRTQKNLLIAHIAACWSPFLCGRFLGHGPLPACVAALCGLAAQLAAWRIIRTDNDSAPDMRSPFAIESLTTRI